MQLPLESKPMQRKKLYVIMPIASDSQSATKRQIIENVAAIAGFDVKFPMDLLRTGGSHDGFSATLDELRHSDLVMADLSLERPSCYYELGLAEAVGANVALIALAGTDIHQAAARHRDSYNATLEEYRDLIASLLAT